MSTGAERFVERAREAGMDISVTTYPSGTRTAADAAAAIGCDVAQIVKSLVFVADDEPILVLTSGVNRVATGKIAAALSAGGVRKADADEVREATGYAIGGTPPFGHDRPLRTLMDQDLLRHDEVWAAAGSSHTVFPVPPGQLAELSDAEILDVARDT